jgi:hypothetical protein
VIEPRPAPAEPPATTRFDVAVTTAPADASIELDGVVVGRGAYRASLPTDGTRHIMSVRADGYEEMALEFTDQPPPQRVVLDPMREAGKAARRTADRAARRPTPPTVTGKRPVKPRPRDADESALTDNPDPWADDRGKSDDKPNEGTQ